MTDKAKLYEAIRESWDRQVDSDKLYIWNAYCADKGNDREFLANDPDEIFRGMCPSEIVEVMEDGHYNSGDAWARNDGIYFWSFETDEDAVCEIDDNDEDDVIEWLIENEHYNEEGSIYYEFI